MAKRPAFQRGLARLFTAFAPFDSSGPVPRNQQFLGVLLLLLVLLTSIAVSAASLNDVHAVVLKQRLQRHYPASFSVFVLVECLFWSWRLDGSTSVSRISWRALKWRVSQDLCGFLCCSEIPQYKRNHIQNHVLYGSALVATLSTLYYVWLCMEKILRDVCLHLDSYVVTVDVIYHASLVAHVWLQIVVVFLHRRGTINADDNKLMGIVLAISLNFAIYFNVVFSKVDNSVPDTQSYTACSAATESVIRTLKHEHSFWIQPVGAALTVEFVVTLNTVLFSLWYHARLKKKVSARRSRKFDNRRVPSSYQSSVRVDPNPDARTRRSYHLDPLPSEISSSNSLSNSTGNSTPRRWSDVAVQCHVISDVATRLNATATRRNGPLAGKRSRNASPSPDHNSIKIRKNPWNLPWIGLLIGICSLLPLVVTSFLTYVDCSLMYKNWNSSKLTSLRNSTESNSLIYSAVGTTSTIAAIILILVSLCILSHMKPMKCLKLHEKIDITVLFITLTGILTLVTFSLTAVAYPWQKEDRELKSAAGSGAFILGVFGLLQTIMITKSYATQSTRRDSQTCKILWITFTRKTLGKFLTEMYIVLLLFNITLWFTGAFHEHQNCSVVQDVNSRFYPKALWFAISRVINPLTLSYYFTSSICYVALISRFAAEYKKPRFLHKSNTRIFSGPETVI